MAPKPLAPKPLDPKPLDPKPLNRWLLLLFVGTFVPAAIALYLMTTDWFQIPVEAWEFSATFFTFLYFILFHYMHTDLASVDHGKEKGLDLLAGIVVAVVGLVWIFLHFPKQIPWTISEADRLGLRVTCGIVMLTVIVAQNWFLLQYWKEHMVQNPKMKEAKDRVIRHELLICMVDLPVVAGLIAVVISCLILMFILSDTAIYKITEYATVKLQPVDTFDTRLTLTSTFYSGAAAFHMLLGNAVFSYIESGRLHQVIAGHSIVRTRK